MLFRSRSGAYREYYEKNYGYRANGEWVARVRSGAYREYYEKNYGSRETVG